MSHYKPYPAYKDSGVAWIGRVPEHWQLKRLRHVATLNPAPEWRELERQRTEYPFLPMEAIGEAGELDVNGRKPLDECRSGYTYFAEGDVVYAKVTPCFENGKGAVIRGLEGCHGFGTTELTVLRATAIDRDYLYALTFADSFRRPGASEMLGSGGLKRVPDEFVRNYRAAIPPIAEQSAIAAGLDRETARIDALISRKTRFIELLKEKRQALITHAVTKGLDPNVKMKDSGVEWIGEVPEHWTLSRLKFVSPSLTVGIVVNPSNYVATDGLPFIYGGDISEGTIDFEKCRRIVERDSLLNAKTRLRAGDLLMVRVGYPGVTAVVPPQCDGGNCASVMLIRRGRYDSEWLRYVLNSRCVRHQIEVVKYGAAQEQFNIGHAVDFLIPVPSASEQQALSKKLLAMDERFHQMHTKTEHSITLLKERRSALITAAVTGKIDLACGDNA